MVTEKKIIDQVSGWLTIFSDGTVDRTWTSHSEVKFMAEPVPPHSHFIHSVSVHDIIADQSSNLRLRIYLPQQPPNPNPTSKLPIILHFHGGGFCISNADWFMYYTVYSKLALAANAIVVSVFLRRSPEHRLPAAADDAFAALLCLRAAAASGGAGGGALPGGEDPGEVCPVSAVLGDRADFSRIFLVGDSSGGNLVHEVAVRAGRTDLAPARIAGAIPIHPGFVRAERSRSEMEMPESPMLTLDMLDKFLALALPVGATKDHPITCPMGPTARLEEARLPPTLLCVAEKDMILDTEMEYFDAMKKANHEVEVYVSPGMSHSFYLNKLAVDTDPETAACTDALFAAIVDFMNRH